MATFSEKHGKTSSVASSMASSSVSTMTSSVASSTMATTSGTTVLVRGTYMATFSEKLITRTSSVASSMASSSVTTMTSSVASSTMTSSASSTMTTSMASSTMATRHLTVEDYGLPSDVGYADVAGHLVRGTYMATFSVKLITMTSSVASSMASSSVT